MPKQQAAKILSISPSPHDWKWDALHHPWDHLQTYTFPLSSLTLSQAWGKRYFLPSRWAGVVGWAHRKVYNLFYIFDLTIHAINFILVPQCTQLNFLQLNTFQIDDKDLTTDNI